MQYCSRCLYPSNHPLGITFDSDGVCSGCLIHEEKDELDWNKRLEKLKKIVTPYKSKKRSIHDCIIPVSGGKDSYFIVDFVKNVLGMHPLLVSYNIHYNTPTGIRNLAYLQTQLECDILKHTSNPSTVKKITNETLTRFGSIYWHCIAGQTVFPVKTAVRFRIPLIIWGAHQGCDQVGMFSHLDEVEMTRKYRKDHDLMGFEAEDLLIKDSSLCYEDIEEYVYPHDKEIEEIGVRGIYLSNYIRWDTKKQHESMIKKYGYETKNQQRTFDNYNDVDSFHYSGLHDLIKYYKWGFGKATDHASREIRLKRMTREEGINYVKRYSQIEASDLNDFTIFSDWLGMSKEEIISKINLHRDKQIWSYHEESWHLKDTILNHSDDKNVDNVRLDVIEKCNFQSNEKRKSPEDNEPGYILMGRGWSEN